MILSAALIIDDIEYDYLTETTLYVVKYYGNAESVVVPETVEGLTVTEIGESAFEGNITLVSIDLPDTIAIIGKRAFAGCTSLQTMN